MNKKENIQVIRCRTKTKNRKNQMHVLPCCQNGKGIAKTCLSIKKNLLTIKVNAFKTGQPFIFSPH
jgi:hypothetical protein